MSWNLIVNDFGSGPGPGFTSLPVDSTGADLIVVSVSTYAASPHSTPIDNYGNTYTGLTVYEATIGWVRLFYCANPVVGAGHVIQVVSDNANAWTASFWSGCDTAAPFDKESGTVALSGTSIQPGSLTPTNDDSLLISAITLTTSINDSAIAVDSGFSSLGGATRGLFNEGGWAASLVLSAAAATNPTWSNYSGMGQVAVTMAVFKGLSGPPPPPPPPPGGKTSYVKLWGDWT